MKIIKNNLYIIKLCYKADPLWIIMQVLSTVLGYVLNTFISIYFLKYIIEAIEGNRSYGEALFLIFGMFFCNVVVNLMDSYTLDILEPKGLVKVTALLMEMLYGQAISVDLSCYENPEFYDTYTKANEQVTGYASTIIRTITRVMGILVSLVVAVFSIVVCEPFVIVIVVLPVLVEQFLVKKYTEYKFNRDRDTAYDRRKVEYVNRTVYLSEFAKDIRLSNIFSPIMRSLEHAMEQMRKTSKEYGVKIAIVRFFRTIMAELFVYLGVQILIVYQYLVHSAYSLGNLSMLLNAASEFSDLIGGFSWARNDIYECGMFIENFRTFMDYKTKMPENENGKIPNRESVDICFKNVGFTYEGSKTPVLKNLNLTIPKGQKIAIVGHNGAGKSTFVKLLMRLYDTTEGSIEVDGIDIKEYRLSAYREIFGTIFQDFKVFAASVTDNILLHGNATERDKERVKEALQNSGIYKKICELKNGIDSQLTKEFDKEGALLSGGEFQKLAVARVFAKDCEICILDEPSSALDPLSEYEIFENMLKACEGKTIIFISHRLSSTVMADKIYMLEKGEIVGSGSHAELMKQNGKYAEMYHMQAKRYQEEQAYEA